MNVRNRAHRILAALPAYTPADSLRENVDESRDQHLGELIGRYRASESQSGAVWIFPEGLAWSEGRRSVSVRFADIASVSLPNGKTGDGLTLKLKNGDDLFLPVPGRQGRFRDSLAMLTFLDRVLEDSACSGPLE